MRKAIFWRIRRFNTNPLIIFAILTGWVMISGLFALAHSGEAQITSNTPDIKKAGVHIQRCVQGSNAVGPGGEKMIDIESHGAGFGEVPGNRYVTFGNYVIESPYGSWSNTHIICRVGLKHFEYGRKYPVCLAMKNKSGLEVRLSNTVYVKPLMLIHQVVPGEARPGAVISLKHSAGITMGWFGGSRGTKELMIGQAQAAVISWSDDQITARVPNMLPGLYKLYIQDGGRTLSEEKPFTVKRSLTKRRIIR
ncbi:MAG: hypothetical protein JXA62_07305 [Candidatus Aminicenantes bacterium]|nr:hypothetical protein [Candidatus Aminicenantes bacterium]